MKAAFIPLLGIMAFASNVAAAQTAPPRELLSPVDAATAARFNVRDSWSLREMLYFAKRYQIVQLNFDVLDEAAEFSVTPFKDLGVRVVRKEQKSDAEGLIFWTGRIVNEPGEDFVNGAQLTTRAQAELLEVNYTINLVERKRPVEGGLDSTRDGQRKFRRPDAPTSNSPGPRTQQLVRAVIGSWFLPDERTTIVISYLEEDPRYHVVYEEDPAKRIEGADVEVRRQSYLHFRIEIEAQRKLKQEPE